MVFGRVKVRSDGLEEDVLGELGNVTAVQCLAGGCCVGRVKVRTGGVAR